MKSVIRFLIIGILNFIGMLVYVCLLPDMTYSSLTMQMEIQGLSSKWFSLFDILVPFIILMIYFFESYYLIRREKLKGRPFPNRGILEWSTMIIYLFTSELAWLKLILQHESYIGVGNILSWPLFYIIGALVGAVFIIIGRLLLRVKRGNEIGFYLPFFMKDHSIWRRTNILTGYFLFFSGLLFIIGAILYETFMQDFLFYGTIITVLVFAFIVPLIYCIYLNIKKKRNEPKQ